MCHILCCWTVWSESLFNFTSREENLAVVQFLRNSALLLQSTVLLKFSYVSTQKLVTR